MWLSTSPGRTRQPEASISSSPCRPVPTATIVSPSISTSASNASVAVTTRPPRMSRAHRPKRTGGVWNVSGTTRDLRPWCRASAACGWRSMAKSWRTPCARCACSRRATRPGSTSRLTTSSKAGCCRAASARRGASSRAARTTSTRRPARTSGRSRGPIRNPSPGYEALRDFIVLLPRPRRRRLARRRARRGPGERLLRRLDHQRPGGPVQGPSRHARLVIRSSGRRGRRHTGLPVERKGRVPARPM